MKLYKREGRRFVETKDPHIEKIGMWWGPSFGFAKTPNFDSIGRCITLDNEYYLILCDDSVSKEMTYKETFDFCKQGHLDGYSDTFKLARPSIQLLFMATLYENLFFKNTTYLSGSTIPGSTIEGGKYAKTIYFDRSLKLWTTNRMPFDKKACFKPVVLVPLNNW